MLPPWPESGKRGLALEPMALFTVADTMFQRRQEVKRYVGRLEVLRISLRYVVDERPECALPWGSYYFAAGSQGGGIHSRQQPGGNRFDVAFHAAELTCEEQFWVSLHLQG